MRYGGVIALVIAALSAWGQGCGEVVVHGPEELAAGGIWSLAAHWTALPPSKDINIRIDAPAPFSVLSIPAEGRADSGVARPVFMTATHAEAGTYWIRVAFEGACPWGSVDDSLCVRVLPNPGLMANVISSGKDSAKVLITNTGNVCRGFTHSIKAILPNLLACFTEISRQMNNQPPKQIYVTGHSLGGALAQHFVSTILMGSVYGPVGQGPEMPNQLHNWPWKQIKLITFGAPSSGDEQWAKTLTTEFLHNYFFSTRFKPTDDSALTITDPQIVERLLDPSQALGWRVLDSTNPITTEKVAGGKHIGKTIYTNTNAGSISSYLQPPSTVSHELVVIREQMCEALSQPSIPPTGWKYYTMQEIHPTRNEKRKGSVEEYRQMMNAIEKFYQTNNMNIDLTSVKSDFDLFIQILGTTP